MLIGLACFLAGGLIVQAAKGSRGAQVAVALICFTLIGFAMTSHSARTNSPDVTHSQQVNDKSEPPEDLATDRFTQPQRIEPVNPAPIPPATVEASRPALPMHEVAHAPTPAMPQTVVIAFSNIRAIPRGAILGQIEEGATITVVDRRDGWLKISRDGDVLGWIYESLVAVRRVD